MNLPLALLGAIWGSLYLIQVKHFPRIEASYVVMFLFFTLGFFTSTQIISYPFVAESNPKHLTATSVSTVSISVISGYAIFQPIFGWLMDHNWQGAIVDNVRIYAASNYHGALVIMPIGFVIALLAALLMKETHCQRKD